MSAIDGIPSVPEIGVLVGEPMADIVDELLDMSTTPAPPIVTDEPPLLLSTTDAAAVHTTASMGATDAPPYKLTASPLPEVAVTPAVAVIDTSANCSVLDNMPPVVLSTVDGVPPSLAIDG